jgi:hypothetical protein
MGQWHGICFYSQTGVRRPQMSEMRMIHGRVPEGRVWRESTATHNFAGALPQNAKCTVAGSVLTKEWNVEPPPGWQLIRFSQTQRQPQL